MTQATSQVRRTRYFYVFWLNDGLPEEGFGDLSNKHLLIEIHHRPYAGDLVQSGYGDLMFVCKEVEFSTYLNISVCVGNLGLHANCRGFGDLPRSKDLLMKIIDEVKNEGWTISDKIVGYKEE